MISSVPSSNRNPHISGIIDQTPLPNVMYNDTQPDERSASPTFSKMRAPSKFNEITKVAFQVDRCYLNKEFYQDNNQSYRKWFFSHFSKDMQQYSRQFITIN